MSVPDIRDIRQRLHYDPETGQFTWKVRPPSDFRSAQAYAAWCHRRVGQIAGTIERRDGYRIILIERRAYRAHRLAWLYVFGQLPPNDIDHINGDRLDNRIVNLRLATDQENSRNRGSNRNNKSGFKGVCWNSARNKWQAMIQHNREKVYLGLFDDPAEASAVYQSAARKLFSDFARTG